MGSIIKRDLVRMTEGVAPAPAALRALPSSGAGASCSSSGPGRAARLLRADGRVRAIEVTCSCGSTTVLEVDYDVVPDVADKETS